MDQTHNDPVADGVEGSAEVFENVGTIAKTEAVAKHPVIAGIRRGPGGVAKGGLKAEWVMTIAGVCTDAQNLIKLHKTQLASDRTSCRSALANQVRLVLHTSAYWLMLTVRDAIPKVRELATAALRLRLLKIAARVVETTSRIRLAFAVACPEADLIRCLPGTLLPLGP